ncbi:MAG: flagellar export chaperone FliS [Thermoguttaceae bacterium]|jgi:flagellar protein FliS
MALTPRDTYAAADVHTAPPQKLQLMLIEAALRSAERARRHWRDGRKDLALGAIVHAQAVLGQMLAAIDRPTGGQLAEKVSAIYDFIFRKLVEAGCRHDEKSLADAVRILQIERETWRLLCEQLAAQGAPGGHGASPEGAGGWPLLHRHAAERPVPGGHVPPLPLADDLGTPSAGLSLEA